MNLTTDKITELQKKVQLYSLAEIAPIIGVSYRTLQRWIKEGKLPAKKVGGRWKMTEKTLFEWLSRLE